MANPINEPMPNNMIFEMPWLQHLALDSDYPLTEADARVVEIAHEALLHADAVEFRLGGKAGRLGECIVETAFLEGVFSLLEQLGKAGTPVTVFVEEAISSLFDDATYADQFWPGIHFQPASDSTTSNNHNQQEPRHLLALDFHGAHDGESYLQYAETGASSATTLGRLHRVAVRSYAHRGPRRRYAAFLEDLFGLPEETIDDLKAQPRIHLNERDETRYPELARAYGLNEEATRIICFFQSVVAAKCYENWDDVMTAVCEHWARSHPLQRVEFFIACGPDDDQPVRCEDLAAFFAGFAGAEGNARVITKKTPSLRDLAILLSRAALCLSNDTGPGHLAGALHIPTITPYLPGDIYPMRVWASTLWHRGVTLPPDAFAFADVENAILNSHTDIINGIPAELLAAQAISALEAQLADRQ
ncbi:MAG TPA: glycosyltransferase family 9 protein [Ktedonobacterales bacterium]|jgi:Glycosyltransferase family 9 (heptosyltransferase)|nr:glycosyltransferase family 9 protein [Ktedonobacterales bacterium]